MSRRLYQRSRSAVRAQGGKAGSLQWALRRRQNVQHKVQRGEPAYRIPLQRYSQGQGARTPARRV